MYIHRHIYIRMCVDASFHLCVYFGLLFLLSPSKEPPCAICECDKRLRGSKARPRCSRIKLGSQSVNQTPEEWTEASLADSALPIAKPK